MNIYAFSGLGTDGRIFGHLEVGHPIIPIRWIEPEKDESLKSYAIRLMDQIDTDQPFGLLGVSFGGMLVVEIAKHTHPQKVILISSAAVYQELPRIASFSRSTGLHRILPARIYKPPEWVAYFGFPLNKRQRNVAQGIIRDMDYGFIKWAIGAIVNWKNDVVPENMMRVHGRFDPIIPLKKSMKTEVIGRGHFIVLKEADEISERIRLILD